MGLTFSVGNPEDALIKPCAERVRESFAIMFPGTVLESDLPSYYSEELPWSGWRLLQEKAVETLGADAVPHFLSMEAWVGCYVPAETEPSVFELDAKKSPLDIASLPALVEELENLGRALGLPIDNQGLEDLWAKYLDEELIDEDFDIQTYAQLLLAAHAAQSRRQVLWIVK